MFKGCSSLTKIYIPSSVTTINASSATSAPFYSCSSSLKIYCEVASKPSGWGSYWNKRTSNSTLTTYMSKTREQYRAA